MKIKNLTPRVQELKIIELVGGREFTIYVEGNGHTELQGAYIPNLSALRGVFEVVGHPTSKDTPVEVQVTTDLVEENPADTSNLNESGTEDLKELEKEPTIVEDKFICDVCGAEFGSARGLASHKNRVHHLSE